MIEKSETLMQDYLDLEIIPVEILSYEDSILQSSVEEIFIIRKFHKYFYRNIEITKPSDSYDSNQSINASLRMFDASLFERIRLVAGARIENSTPGINCFFTYR